MSLALGEYRRDSGPVGRQNKGGAGLLTMADESSQRESSRYANRRTESVADYDDYWYWSETGQPMSLRRLKFAGYIESNSTFPLAVFEFDEPASYRGSKYHLGLVGSKAYPNTVRRVYRWPLDVNLGVMLNEANLESGSIADEDRVLFEVGVLEPVIFGGPHWSLSIPGGLGEDLLRLPPQPVVIPPGKWWESEPE